MTPCSEVHCFAANGKSNISLDCIFPLTQKHPLTNKFIWEEEKVWFGLLNFISQKITDTSENLIRNVLPPEVMKWSAEKHPVFKQLVTKLNISV